MKNYWKVTGTNDETFPYILIDKWYNPEELEGVWKELDFYQSCPDHHQVRTEDKETPVAREPGGLFDLRDSIVAVSSILLFVVTFLVITFIHADTFLTTTKLP